MEEVNIIEEIIEVPVERIIDKPVERVVEKFYDNEIEEIDYVDNIIEDITYVDKPVTVLVEKIVEKPTIVYKDVIREVAIDKLVEK